MLLFLIESDSNCDAKAPANREKVERMVSNQIRFPLNVAALWLRNTSNFSFGFLVLHEIEAIFFRLARRHGSRRFRHNRCVDDSTQATRCFPPPESQTTRMP